jgi:sugar/nucleoside kinase (ribokinase family)
LTPSEGSPKRFKFNRVSGADLLLQQDDVDLEMIRSAAVLHLTSLMLISEPSRSAQLKAIKVARESGGLISFDVNHRPGLWPDKNEALLHIRSLVSTCDILKVNETELEILTGTQDPGKGIPVLLAEGVNLVAVTLGEKGCYYATKETYGYIPAYKIIDVDPLGCGDAFTAGMLVKILEEKKSISHLLNDDLLRVFRFANAVGALTSTRQGAISSLPKRSEVDQLISKCP